MKNLLLLLILFFLGYTLLKAILRLFTSFSENKNNTGKKNSFFHKKGNSTITYEDDSVNKKQYGKDDGEYIDYEEVK
jgi:hypothetical protein